MLIHTHYRRAVHNQLTQEIRDHVSRLRQEWRYDRARIRPALEQRWNERFRPTIRSLDATRDVPFSDIEAHIDRLFRDPLPVLVLNSDSDDQLDYDADPNLKAVVIGGNRLSRGLTLEGLLVSYYVRRTQYFDTLMQMGRWFGFRETYVDLTRIWTTQELAEWFRDLALAEEELRCEIGRYERENLTPLDFGPRIRCHPAMMITARNKMGSARVIQQNYAGHLLQTTLFRFEDRAWLESNLNAAHRLVQSLGEPNYQPIGAEVPSWHSVPWQEIDRFLAEYSVHPGATHELGAIRQYIREQTRQGELSAWHVSMRERPNRDETLGVEPALGVAGHPRPSNIANEVEECAALDRLADQPRNTRRRARNWRRGGRADLGSTACRSRGSCRDERLPDSTTKAARSRAWTAAPIPHQSEFASQGRSAGAHPHSRRPRERWSHRCWDRVGVPGIQERRDD